MRLVRSAIWTSGEPVSVPCRRCGLHDLPGTFPRRLPFPSPVSFSSRFEARCVTWRLRVVKVSASRSGHGTARAGARAASGRQPPRSLRPHRPLGIEHQVRPPCLAWRGQTGERLLLPLPETHQTLRRRGEGVVVRQRFAHRQRRAAGRRRRAARPSRVASASEKRPTRVRRSSSRWATVPSAAPMSRRQDTHIGALRALTAKSIRSGAPQPQRRSAISRSRARPAAPRCRAGPACRGARPRASAPSTSAAPALATGEAGGNGAATAE